MKPEIVDAFNELDTFESLIPCDKIKQWIDQCGIDSGDALNFCRYHPSHYMRNLMRAGPAYHALVLCWRNGQRSPIHDHQGSRCAVKVLAGEALETTFERAPNGMLFPVSSSVLPENSTCYSEDADIHQISNLQADQADLVTLHVYSPPLLRMNVYSLEGEQVREFWDPLNSDFSPGAGI